MSGTATLWSKYGNAGSKAYQSSGLCSSLLFVFSDMVFVIILIEFFIINVSSFFKNY